MSCLGVAFLLACGPKPAVETPTEPADAGVDTREPLDSGPPDAPIDVPPVDAGPSDPIPEASHALQLGGEVSCLLHQGAVYCWGSNRFGELATTDPAMGARGRRERAARIELPSAAALSVGMWHACALIEDGSLRCWGHGGWGQLGDGAREDRTEPVVVAGIESVVQVSAGGGHTCARTHDRRAFCWGRNDVGQLGDGTTEARLEPQSIDLAGVMEIRAARAHTCARLEDGSVWCWGENVDGQLGDDSRSPPLGYRATPARVEGVEDARAIRVGGGASCAVVGDTRDVLCWGRNDSRQLVARPGGRSNSALGHPTPMPEASGIDDLGLGSRFTCVLADHAVRCAGLNHRGQLGDGTRRLRRSLTPVDLADVAQLGVGPEHACARTQRGVVRCWGANRRGQLGDGTIRWRTDPVVVQGVPRPTPPPTETIPDAGPDSAG